MDMTPFRHAPVEALQETSMKDPYVLVAASLFLGGTLADAQSGSAPVAQPQVAAVPAVAFSVPAPDDSNRQFAEAVHLYKSGRWSAAYGHFAALADRGHVRASRIALTMFRNGPELYGIQWDATASQLNQWQRFAFRKGDSGAVIAVNK